MRSRLLAARYALVRHNVEEAMEHVEAMLQAIPATASADYALVRAGVYKEPEPPIEGWMSPDELNWLFRLGTRYRRIAEVGCWMGRSTHALLSGQLVNEGTLWAVDHFRGSESEPTVHAYAHDHDLEALFRKNLTGFTGLRVLSMPSVEAAKLIDDDSLDAVFLDGDHGYEWIAADLRAWAPKIRDGRVLCGHDVTQDGVPRAIEEFFGFLPTRLVGSIWGVKRDGSKWVDYSVVGE